MELGRVASFFNLCAVCYGITYIPANLNTRLGNGYDFGFAKERSPALEPVLACGSSSVIACKKNVSDSNTYSYTQTVKTREEYDQLMSVVATAEGGGWGVSVSSGVTAMEASNTSESSWTYFVGSGTHVSAEQVTNAGKLLLTDAARTYLEKDPMGFLNVYGKHYISSVVYGGSFMGSISLTEKDQSGTKDLDVFANVDVKEAFYNVKASADFQDKIKSTASTVEQWVQVTYLGGGVIPSKTDSPKDIGDMFVKWQESIAAQPKPLLVTVRPYFDSEEVQEVVLQHSQDVIDAFQPTTITQTTTDQFSSDYGKLILVLTSIQQAYNWTTTKSSETLKKKLDTLFQTCTTYKVRYDMATEVDMLARQSEIEHGNYSWFMGDTLLDEFEEIKESAPPSPAPVVRPEVVKTTGSGTTVVKCPSGKVLTSCSMKMHKTEAEPYWSVYPKSVDSCSCYDDGYGDGVDECFASCVDTSAQTDVRIVSATSNDRFTTSCPSGYKVTGCGIRQNRIKKSKEKYSYVYPSSDSSCECYNKKQDVDCYATCSKNIDNHKIVHKSGKGTWDVTCPDGRSALGCGFKIDLPATEDPEKYPQFWPIDYNTCRCYNYFGMTCYAICGNMTSGTSSLVNTNAAIVTTDMLI